MDLELIQLPVHLEIILKSYKTRQYNNQVQETISDVVVMRQPTLSYEFQEPVKDYISERAESSKRMPVYYTRQQVVINGKKTVITNPIPLIDEDGNEVFKLQHKITKINNPSYIEVKNEYMALINSFREHDTDEFVGGMPVQLQKDCISQLFRGTRYQQLIYSMTLKADGLRNLLFLSKTGILYLIDRSLNIYYFRRPSGFAASVEPTDYPFLFDGELVYHSNGRFEYLIFDVIICQDRGILWNWINNNYYDRLYIIHKATSFDLKAFTEFDITSKIWFPLGDIKDELDIYEYVKKETNKIRKSLKLPKLVDDGLILQPWDGFYVPFREWNVYNNVQFKWKPPDRLTIDVKLKTNPNNKKEWWLLTKRDQEYMVKQDDGQNIHAIVKKTETLIKNFRDNDVVECKLDSKFNSERNIFKIILKRTDKTEGNSLETIMSTMNVVSNPFTLDIIKPAITSIISQTNVKDIIKFMPFNKLALMSVDIFFTNSEINSIKNLYNLYFGISDDGLLVEDQEDPMTGDELPGILLENPELNEPEISTMVNPGGIDFERGNEFGTLKEILSSIEKMGTSPIQRKSQYELELRIYPYIKKRKTDNLKKFTYYYLLDYFRKTNMNHTMTYSIDILENTGSQRSGFEPTYRSTYGSLDLTNPINQIKTRIREYRSIPKKDTKFPLTYKLSLSTETDTSKVVRPQTQKQNGIVYNKARVKYRDSFLTFDGLWRVDITRVITTNNLMSGTGTETYELECEYVSRQVDFDTFLRSMSDIYKKILFNSNYC
jgi:hypothetical protein